MQGDALLALATELLTGVLKLDRAADAVVAEFFRKHRALGPRERHALTETVYAVLRRRLLYQRLAAGGSGPAGRRLVLVAWQGGQTLLHGALSVHEQSWLAAVKQIDRDALPENTRHNLPEWLATDLRAAAGDGFWPLVQALSEAAPLDLRVNLLKARREDVQRAMTEAGYTVAPTAHSPWGLRVQGKPALHQLDIFRLGQVEVQDEGSQLLALLTDPKRGEMVVDFCAGAGGKTLALGAAMRNTGRLYAFDVSGHRLEGMKTRLARSGLSNVHPAQIAHERDERIKRLAGKIDRVLVDAPCSGLGTLRRNPELKWRQSPKRVDELRAGQAAILDGAAKLVKPGGRLVYATCSLLGAENEQVAETFTAGRRDEFLPVPALQALQDARAGDPGRLVTGPYLRLWPHLHGTDGFFAAVWQKH